MIDSHVGYIGGSTDNPTYQSVCAGDGHTEALRLEFDPKVTSFEEIMMHFYEDPRVQNQFCSDDSGGGRSAMDAAQYRTAVWALNEEQRDIALRVSDETGKEIPVLSPGKKFHIAEQYHQHYCDPSARRNEWKTPPRPAAKPWGTLIDVWGNN